jgi:hypothetical protein
MRDWKREFLGRPRLHLAMSRHRRRKRRRMRRRMGIRGG